ncbi:MAG: hypothetical protein K6B12_06645, partial [Clostridiales bacterium]|nr:hypothetical protein [Clostridiales bacterium]
LPPPDPKICLLCKMSGGAQEEQHPAFPMPPRHLIANIRQAWRCSTRLPSIPPVHPGREGFLFQQIRLFCKEAVENWRKR